MASTAALLQGEMASFDSSAVVQEEGDTRAAGGITFGSVAPSFHSEDEDDERQHWPVASRPQQQQQGKGKGRYQHEQESSLMDEQEMQDDDDAQREPWEDSALGPSRPPSTRRTFPSSLAHLDGEGANTTADDSEQPSLPQAGVPLAELSNVDDPSYLTSPRAAGVGGGVLARINGAVGQKKKSAGAGMGQNMTLREQEKVIDEFKKENFDLKLKIHFYHQRLESLAPEQMVLLSEENTQLRLEFSNARAQLKLHKKLLKQADAALEALNNGERALVPLPAAGRGNKRERELEKELLRMKREKEDWEVRVRELEAGKGSARGRKSKGGSTDDWDQEDARAEISHLRHELSAERDAKEEALGTASDLRDELRATQDMLDEAQDRSSSRRGGGGHDDSSAFGANSTRGGGREQRLQEENHALQDEVETLKNDLLQLEEEVEQLQLRRGGDGRRDLSRSVGGGEKSREELEEELDEHRDRASSHALQVEQLEQQLQEKEAEIEELLGDIEQRDVDHKTILEEKNNDIEQLADKIESLMQELTHKEAEMKADLKEVDDLTHDLQKLGAQIFSLEEEADLKDDRIRELETELDQVDKELEEKMEMHEQVVGQLKEKHSTTKARLGEISTAHDSTLSENKLLREKVTELSARTNELEERTKSDLEAKRRLEDEAVEIMRALRKEEEERDLDRQEWNRQRRDEEHKWQKSLEVQSKDATQAQAEVAHLKSLLSIREGDLQSLQDALNGLEASSRRLGEEKNNDRFASELELERLKRDFARCEDELARTRKEIEEKKAELRERDMDVAALHSENKDLAAQLASQTQTRLGVTDKYDQAAKTLRDTQDELSMARDRLRVVEDQLNSDHRALSRTENQYRDQLTERNTLLLTIHDTMNRIIAAPPRKAGQSDLKPFGRDFGAFHESLMQRLKSISQIQLSFERRTQEMAASFTERFSGLKKQQDSRLKQLDRFEETIKTAVETQRKWRERVNQKTIEVNEAKAANASLQSQLASARRGSPGSPSTGSPQAGLAARAERAERHLARQTEQLATAERLLEEGRAKLTAAEKSWEARLMELQRRLKVAEEKVKRERQGAKERVQELDGRIGELKGQVEGARRRDQQLGDVIQTEAERRAASRGSNRG